MRKRILMILLVFSLVISLMPNLIAEGSYAPRPNSTEPYAELIMVVGEELIATDIMPAATLDEWEHELPEPGTTTAEWRYPLSSSNPEVAVAEYFQTYTWDDFFEEWECDNTYPISSSITENYCPFRLKAVGIGTTLIEELDLFGLWAEFISYDPRANVMNCYELDIDFYRDMYNRAYRLSYVNNYNLPDKPETYKRNVEGLVKVTVVGSNEERLALQKKNDRENPFRTITLTPGETYTYFSLSDGYHYGLSWSDFLLAPTYSPIKFKSVKDDNPFVSLSPGICSVVLTKVNDVKSYVPGYYSRVGIFPKISYVSMGKGYVDISAGVEPLGLGKYSIYSSCLVEVNTVDATFRAGDFQKAIWERLSKNYTASDFNDLEYDFASQGALEYTIKKGEDLYIWLDAGRDSVDDINSNKVKLVYKSSNEKVAEVLTLSNACHINGISKGTATISVKYKGKTYKCKITVEE